MSQEIQFPFCSFADTCLVIYLDQTQHTPIVAFSCHNVFLLSDYKTNYKEVSSILLS